MVKVSVGLRGWRFEESEVFTDKGEFKSLDGIPEDPRERLMRLVLLIEGPCDACYLIHDDEEMQQCRQAAIVYGEPREEVFLREYHEPDFLYWFRERDGHDLVGDAVFANAFYEWFAADSHASDGYDGLEYVDTEPDKFSSPPNASEIQRRLEENFVEGERINLHDYGSGTDGEDGTPLTEDDLGGADLGTDYPAK